MARTCTICTHSDREAIDGALLRKDSMQTIAARWSLSKPVLMRHQAHLPSSLAGPAPMPEVLEVKESGAVSMVERVKALSSETVAILRDARAADSKDNELALKAIALIEKQIELEERLLGELKEGSAVDVTASSEWQNLRGVILKALAPYPVAQMALLGALKNAGA